LEAYPEGTEARIETNQEPMEAETKTGLVEMEATDLEANPEEKEAMVEQQKVPNEDATVKITRALNNRSGDRRLTIRRCGLLKKWAQSGHRSWKSWSLPEEG
jgi:hypothetical protein